MVMACANCNASGQIARTGHPAVLQPNRRTERDASDVGAFTPKFEACSADMGFTYYRKFSGTQIVPKVRPQSFCCSFCQRLMPGSSAVRPIVCSVCPDSELVSRELHLQKTNDCGPPSARRLIVNNSWRSSRAPPKAERPIFIDVPVRAENWQAFRRFLTHTYCASSCRQF